MNKLPNGFTVTAHTGCMGTKMNSISSIEKGIGANADIVEFDLNFDKNGNAVLSHDEPKAGNPTLAQAFEVVSKSEKVKVNVDVKSTYDLSVVEKTAKEYGISERIFFTGIAMDFIPSAQKTNVAYYLNYKPIPPIFQTKSYAEKIAKLVKSVGAVGLNARFSLVSSTLVKVLKQNGLLVSLWTANNESQMKKCIRLAPNNITTQHPDVLLKLLSDIR